MRTAFTISRRIHDNGKVFTVVLDRTLLGRPLRPNRQPLPGQLFDVLPIDRALLKQSERPALVRGVLLTDYLVTRDDDPTYRAWLTLGGSPVMGTHEDYLPAQVQVDRIVIQRGGKPLDTTTLPIAKLLKACIDCGSVAMGLNPDGTYSFVPDEHNKPLPAAEVDELVGARQRRNARRTDLHDQVEQAMREQALAKDRWRADKENRANPKPANQETFVAEALGITVHYAKELCQEVRDRRKAATANTTRNRGKK